MPLYEYEVQKCHHHYERIQKIYRYTMSENTRTTNEPVEQVIFTPAVKFRGSGYVISPDYTEGS